MSIKLRRQASGTVANPPTSHVAFFIDQSGTPSLKDSTGVVSPAVTVDGTPLSLDEQSTAPTTEANKVKLYAKDVSGASEFFVKDDAGNEVQVTSAGAVNAAGAFNINWKGGTPGNPYVDTDTANAAAGDLVVVSVVNPGTAEIVTIQFPAADSSNVGLVIAYQNSFDQKATTPGEVRLAPASGGRIGQGLVDEIQAPTDLNLAQAAQFVSDGNGTWVSIILGGASWWGPAP